MLQNPGAGISTAGAQATRLVVEPPAAVRGSVLPGVDPERAAAHATDAGVPLDLLARFDASERQTHRRARVVAVDVPADGPAGRASALRALGHDERPPWP